jgi:hypothetical protein
VNPLALRGAVKAWTICDINRRDSQRPGEGVFEVTLGDHMGWGGRRWSKIPRLWQSRPPADTRRPNFREPTRQSSPSILRSTPVHLHSSTSFCLFIFNSRPLNLHRYFKLFEVIKIDAFRCYLASTCNIVLSSMLLPHAHFCCASLVTSTAA